MAVADAVRRELGGLPAIGTTHLDDIVDDLAGLGLLSAGGP